MTSYGYGFCPQSPSYTAMKYLREYIPHRAMLPGERYRLHLDMEAKVTTKYSFLDFKIIFICQASTKQYIYDKIGKLQVRGYREINRDMRDLSVEIDRRRRIMTSPDRELTPPCTFKQVSYYSMSRNTLYNQDRPHYSNFQL